MVGLSQSQMGTGHRDGPGPGKSTQPRASGVAEYGWERGGGRSSPALDLEQRATYVAKERAHTCYLFVIMNKSVSNLTPRLSFKRQKKKSHYKMQFKEIDFLETPQESNV